MFDLYASAYAARVKDPEGRAYTLDVYLLLVPGSKTQNGSATKSLDATATQHSSSSVSALQTGRARTWSQMAIMRPRARRTP